MFEIPSGTHHAKAVGLTYQLETPLTLPPGSCLFLTGDNGAGKTTFVEHILIPHLRTTHTPLYIAQDMELQQNTMAATLALLQKDAPPDLADLAAAWINACPCRDVLILDEFDKYATSDDLEKMRVLEFCWLVSISHTDTPRIYRKFLQGFCLHLTRDARQRDHVHMEFKPVWP